MISYNNCIISRFFLQDLIREADPDVMIGYNICKFDLPYLIEVTLHFTFHLEFHGKRLKNETWHYFLFCLLHTKMISLFKW